MKPVLSETDLLKLQLANETQARLELQLQALHTQGQQLQANLQLAQAKRTSLIETLRKEYGLGEKDQVSLETGVITRAPEATPAEAPKPATKRAKKAAEA